MNTKLLISVLSIILTVSFPVISWAETVLERVNRTGVLDAGVREDAIPFSYTDENQNLEGYSVELVKLIHRRLEKELNKPIKLQLKTVSIEQRFQWVQNGTLDLVCSADSITPEREAFVDFSIPFFTSGIQLLVRKEDAPRLDPTQTSEADLQMVTREDLSIGFIQGTTTDSEFRPIYPEAKWQILGNRTEGVRRLKSQDIDGVASDGILLLGELWKQGDNFQEFQLVPAQPLTFEDYGCILPEKNPQWSNLVNSTITSAENTDLFNQWFDPETGRFPYQRFNTSASQ